MTYKLNPAATPLLCDPAEVERRVSALEKLLSRTVDAKACFDTMLEKTEPEFRPTVEKFQKLCGVHPCVAGRN